MHAPVALRWVSTLGGLDLERTALEKRPIETLARLGSVRWLCKVHDSTMWVYRRNREWCECPYEQASEWAREQVESASWTCEKHTVIERESALQIGRCDGWHCGHEAWMCTREVTLVLLAHGLAIYG
jgi:hypothetical protein